MAGPPANSFLKIRSDSDIDVADLFRKNNPSLCDSYGTNRWSYAPTYKPEYHNYYAQREALGAHGYPLTFVLQAGIFYSCAYYTAHQQGLPSPHNFFKSHWFDWIT